MEMYIYETKIFISRLLDMVKEFLQTDAKGAIL